MAFFSFLLLAAPVCADAQRLTVDVDNLWSNRAGGGEVTAVVRNEGETPVELPKVPAWDAGGGLTLLVTAPDGSTKIVAPAADTSEPQSTPLAPRASIGVSRPLSGEDFPESGTYKVVARYTGPGGTVTSEPVEVMVSRDPNSIWAQPGQ